MKLYRFDGVDASLSLIPLAGRRALDAIGAKLSLTGFLSLSLERRRALVVSGSGAQVDQNAARKAIALARPLALPCPVLPDPDPLRPSAALVEAFGGERPLSVKVWQGLSPLDRYALSKVAQKRKPERLQGAWDEIIGASAVSTHLRPAGGVHMVSISEKSATLRTAVAECWISMQPTALERLLSGEGPKGDVLSTARLAGIMATKKTSDLIPLCHPLALQHVEVDFEPDRERGKVRVTCRAEVDAKTGVEMEAMVGANVAALTIYDMLKSVDRSMEIGPSRLIYKAGGRSGTFERSEKP